MLYFKTTLFIYKHLTQLSGEETVNIFLMFPITLSIKINFKNKSSNLKIIKSVNRLINRLITNLKLKVDLLSNKNKIIAISKVA
jgi:hypothetical protein